MKRHWVSIHRLLIASATLFVIACSPSANKSFRDETPECMKYRSMMTAPMPPAAIMQLEDQCKRSRQ